MKDNTYNEILLRLNMKIGQSNERDLYVIFETLTELLQYLDEKEDAKTRPTFD